MTSHHPHQHQHQHAPSNHQTHQHSDDAAMAEMLDRDAQVLKGHLQEILDWTKPLAGTPERILDVGAGTGTGTFALAHTFPGALVTALDISEYMLGRLAASVTRHGLEGRVTTRQADLDESWPALGELDMIWAASSMHHMSDASRTFSDIYQSLAPDGLLVVVEMDSLPRYLPDDLGWGVPGLEQRCHDVAAALGWNAHPDWRPALEQAGFTVAEQKTFSYEQSENQQLIADAARSFLSRTRESLNDHLTTDDLSAVDQLLDERAPHSLGKRTDLMMRGSRTVWVARRK
ncbi:MAG: class I SAM-dependent methyltransferase [Paeniglutamicibacter terrestris]